jgi:putative transposase
LNAALENKNDFIIGFLDETSPQTAANTQRLWSFTKPVIKKNTAKIRANTFGFYALNGESQIAFKEDSKKQSVCNFLEQIRDANPGKDIVVILDNFRSHWAKKTREKALELNIFLVFLPPYSPDLNPIEFIWKSIRRHISPLFIDSKEMFFDTIQGVFSTLAKSLSFAAGWIDEYLRDRFYLFC